MCFMFLTCILLQFTTDDAVGCVELGLGRLSKESPLEGWQSVTRPRTLSLSDRLWQWLTGPPPQAELRLCATVLVSNNDLEGEGEEVIDVSIARDTARHDLSSARVNADIVCVSSSSE